MSKQLHEVIRQDWLESERGWGCRSDGYSLHKNDEDRRLYIEAYWRGMPDAVPDEYSSPCGDPHTVKVDPETYEKVFASTRGTRHY